MEREGGRSGQQQRGKKRGGRQKEMEVKGDTEKGHQTCGVYEVTGSKSCCDIGSVGESMLH